MNPSAFRCVTLEVLPAYWGIETRAMTSEHSRAISDLEVLPAYWGIETLLSFGDLRLSPALDLEVLPAYWGIETPWLGTH